MLIYFINNAYQPELDHKPSSAFSADASPGMYLAASCELYIADAPAIEAQLIALMPAPAISTPAPAPASRPTVPGPCVPNVRLLPTMVPSPIPPTVPRAVQATTNAAAAAALRNSLFGEPAPPVPRQETACIADTVDPNPAGPRASSVLGNHTMALAPGSAATPTMASDLSPGAAQPTNPAVAALRDGLRLVFLGTGCAEPSKVAIPPNNCFFSYHANPLCIPIHSVVSE